MQLPPAHLSAQGPGRRTVLRGAGGAAALGAGVPLLSACSGSESAATRSRIVPVSARARRMPFRRARSPTCTRSSPSSSDSASRSTPRTTTRYRSRAPPISQALPDDVFQLYRRLRMQFFAAKGFATPIADAWKTISGTFPPPCRTSARERTADDLRVLAQHSGWCLGVVGASTATAPASSSGPCATGTNQQCEHRAA